MIIFLSGGPGEWKKTMGATKEFPDPLGRLVCFHYRGDADREIQDLKEINNGKNQKHQEKNPPPKKQ